jgi:hypothetical protein
LGGNGGIDVEALGSDGGSVAAEVFFNKKLQNDKGYGDWGELVEGEKIEMCKKIVKKLDRNKAVLQLLQAS